MRIRSTQPPGPTALCLGHPGHELKILAWAEQHRPLVSILTDGSGSNRASRLETSAEVLAAAGCPFSQVFGHWTDRQIYDLMLRRAVEPMIAVADIWVREWRTRQIRTVVGDALEGFSTTHDLCRMLINAAQERCRLQGWDVETCCIYLDSVDPKGVDEATWSVDLDEATLAKKLVIVRNSYSELAGDVERLLAQNGPQAYRRESLWPAQRGLEGMRWQGKAQPFYEEYGARQIAAGHYTELITNRDHLEPIAHALWTWATARPHDASCECSSPTTR